MRYPELMSAALDRLLADALALSGPERARLATRLIESLEPTESDADHDAAWVTEIERRRGELESGAVKGIPVDEAMRIIRGPTGSAAR